MWFNSKTKSYTSTSVDLLCSLSPRYTFNASFHSSKVTWHFCHVKCIRWKLASETFCRKNMHNTGSSMGACVCVCIGRRNKSPTCSSAAGPVWCLPALSESCTNIKRHSLYLAPRAIAENPDWSCADTQLLTFARETTWPPNTALYSLDAFF